jgi:hypothetical protein
VSQVPVAAPARTVATIEPHAEVRQVAVATPAVAAVAAPAVATYAAPAIATYAASVWDR